MIPDKETDARILIDAQLREAGWNPSDKSQVRTEVYAVSTSVLGDSSVIREESELVSPEKLRCDYVLLDMNGRPLAVLEAKRRNIDPYTAKQQTLPYARSIGAPFIFLSNGEVIYFWDYTQDDARLVQGFFSRTDLERLRHQRENRQPLATVAIPEGYLRQGEQRLLRDYQIDAMKALDQAIELGKRQFLIELPTGCGKTDLTVLYIKRLMQAGRAQRILFLVDRDQLAKQAIEAVQDLLPQHSSYWLKAGMAFQHKEITVCLLQTMIGRYTEFTSGYFDVVVADECHRSIYGAWARSLVHFDAFHLGLTATPAAYIERNTFKFYHCKDGKPDFTYPITLAFELGQLTPYKFAEGITELLAEGTEVDGENFDPAEFERRWTNDATNRLMMEEFDRLAHENYRDLAPGQKNGPGKSIVFAITKQHAARLCRILNELHPEHAGNYAKIITSDCADPDELIRQFKREVYPQVAVTVGMLDTGFDCREVLHIVLCRRIRSAILYQQIRGRGTRTAPHIGKRRFVIYDFFHNHQHFGDSDENVFTGSGVGAGGGSRETGGEGPRELIELGLDDSWLEKVAYVEVGPDGERFDKREYITHWEQAVRSAEPDDIALRKLRAGEQLTAEEEADLERKLNRPDYYFNEDNLRHAYRQPGGNIVDFIRAALGTAKVKSRDEELAENFGAWLVTKSFTPAQASYLTLLKNRGIARGKLDLTDLFQPPLSVLNAAPRGLELFGEDGLKDIIRDLNETVFRKQA